MIFSPICIISGWITWGRKSGAIHLLLLSSSIIPWTYAVLILLNSPSGLCPMGHYPTGFFGGFLVLKIFGPRRRLLGMEWSKKSSDTAATEWLLGYHVSLLFVSFLSIIMDFIAGFIGEFMVGIHVSELYRYLRASSPLSRIILNP